MATVKGPLFSLDASGSIGGSVVFAKWKGRNYCRRHAVPANPKSVLQVGTRAMLRFLSQQWDGLTDGEKATWDVPAAPNNISPFNAYIGYNMSRWALFQYPTQSYPAAEANVAATFDTPVCTAQTKSVLTGFTVNPLQQNWGAAIFRKIDGAPGESRAECVRIIPAASAAAFTWTDIEVVVGTDYYYDATPFSDDGVKGTELQLGNAVPTA